MQNKYEILSVIGEGSYGIVYKCRNRETNEIVAIKKFKDNTELTANKSMMRELKSLKIFNHKNIISFRESFKKKNNYFFVFDYIEKNLLEFLTDYPEGIEPNLIKHIMFQICSGIQQIHKYSLVHRDIKPENILIDRMHKVKICDFGFTRFIEKNSDEYLTEYVATRWYRAPELLIGDKNYGLEIDYWSVGCIMGELIDGNPIFPGENDMEQIYMIYKICGKEKFSYEQIQIIEKKHNIAAAKVEKTKYINPLNNSEISIEVGLDKRYSGKISRDALNFLKRLLDPNPQTRIKSDEIFDHPYLLNYCHIFAANNELYINNFDIYNKFAKPPSNSSGSSTYGNITKQNNINNNFNNPNNANNNINSSHYPKIINNNNNNNTQNNFNNAKLNLNNMNNLIPTKPNSRNKNSNFNYGPNHNTINNMNFGPIIENFFEHIDTNGYEEAYASNTNANNLASFAIANTNSNNNNMIQNGLITGNNENMNNKISFNNNENFAKENNENNANDGNANAKYNKKNNKAISLEKPKIDGSSPLGKSLNSDFYGNEDLKNLKFNNYNIEALKPPNKEERNNYNYYNNIKLYNEDLFEKTGKIKKSVNPYESIYKITSQIKKENDKKVKKDKDKNSNLNQNPSGNTNNSNSNNVNNNNNNSRVDVNSPVSGISNKIKDFHNSNNNNNKNAYNNKHMVNNINMLKIDTSDFSPVIENKNLSTYKKTEKNFNTQSQLSMNMNYDKNKIFLSPQKQDKSAFFFNSGSHNFFSSNDSSNNNNNNNSNNNNNNYNYSSLINFNIGQNDKTKNSNIINNNNNNNISVYNSSNFEKTSFNDFKNLASNSKQNNLNKNNQFEKSFPTNLNFSPDSVRSNNNNNNYSIHTGFGTTKYANNNVNLNTNFNNNLNTISNSNSNEFATKSNKFRNNSNINLMNSNEFSTNKSISLSKNGNLNINTLKDNNANNAQINDFFKNMVYHNNKNIGLVTVKNSNEGHARFNSLNGQNAFLIHEENKKSNSLQKLQLPLINKNELGKKL